MDDVNVRVLYRSAIWAGIGISVLYISSIVMIILTSYYINQLYIKPREREKEKAQIEKHREQLRQKIKLSKTKEKHRKRFTQSYYYDKGNTTNDTSDNFNPYNDNKNLNLNNDGMSSINQSLSIINQISVNTTQLTSNTSMDNITTKQNNTGTSIKDRDLEYKPSLILTATCIGAMIFGTVFVVSNAIYQTLILFVYENYNNYRNSCMNYNINCQWNGSIVIFFLLHRLLFNCRFHQTIYKLINIQFKIITLWIGFSFVCIVTIFYLLTFTIFRNDNYFFVTFSILLIQDQVSSIIVLRFLFDRLSRFLKQNLKKKIDKPINIQKIIVEPGFGLKVLTEKNYNKRYSSRRLNNNNTYTTKLNNVTIIPNNDDQETDNCNTTIDNTNASVNGYGSPVTDHLTIKRRKQSLTVPSTTNTPKSSGNINDNKKHKHLSPKSGMTTSVPSPSFVTDSNSIANRYSPIPPQSPGFISNSPQSGDVIKTASISTPTSLPLTVAVETLTTQILGAPVNVTTTNTTTVTTNKASRFKIHTPNAVNSNNYIGAVTGKDDNVNFQPTPVSTNVDQLVLLNDRSSNMLKPLNPTNSTSLYAGNYNKQNDDDDDNDENKHSDSPSTTLVESMTELISKVLDDQEADEYNVDDTNKMNSKVEVARMDTNTDSNIIQYIKNGLHAKSNTDQDRDRNDREWVFTHAIASATNTTATTDHDLTITQDHDHIKGQITPMGFETPPMMPIADTASNDYKYSRSKRQNRSQHHNNPNSTFRSDSTQNNSILSNSVNAVDFEENFMDGIDTDRDTDIPQLNNHVNDHELSRSRSRSRSKSQSTNSSKRNSHYQATNSISSPHSINELSGVHHRNFKELKKTRLRMLQEKRDDQIYQLIVRLVSLQIICIIFSWILYLGLYSNMMIAAMAIDICFNSICIMLSFPFSGEKYHRLCCLCVRCTTVCEPYYINHIANIDKYLVKANRKKSKFMNPRKKVNSKVSTHIRSTSGGTSDSIPDQLQLHDLNSSNSKNKHNYPNIHPAIAISGRNSHHSHGSMTFPSQHGSRDHDMSVTRSRTGMAIGTSLSRTTAHSFVPSVVTTISAKSDVIEFADITPRPATNTTPTTMKICKQQYDEYKQSYQHLYSNGSDDDATAATTVIMRDVYGISSDSLNSEYMIGSWCIEDPIESLIGKGAFSKVYKGIDYNLKLVVAIKLIDDSDKREEKLKETQWMAKNEIECLGKVSHSNVIKMLGYDQSAHFNGNDVIAFVLEYTPNGDLRDLIGKLGALSDILARTYIHQIISGVSACHKAGVIHRDLKLENIVLDSGYNAKICDFGLAKSSNDLKIKAHCVGTRVYRAPEVTMMQDYNEMCDIFSIGVILFMILANQRPFRRAIYMNNNGNYVKGEGYELFCDDNQKYWNKYVRKAKNINPNARKLVYSMLEYDSTKRISISQIMQHSWYKKDIIHPNNLKQQIKSLLDKFETIKQFKKLNNNNKNKKTSIAINSHESSESSSDDDDNDNNNQDTNTNCLYTTSDWHLVRKTIANYIETNLKGKTIYYQESQTLHCIVDSNTKTKLKPDSQTETQKIEFEIKVVDWNWDEVKENSNELNVINENMLYTHVLFINMVNSGDIEQFSTICVEMLKNKEISSIVSDAPPTDSNFLQIALESRIRQRDPIAIATESLVTIDESKETTLNSGAVKHSKHLQLSKNKSNSSFLTGLSQISSKILSTNNKLNVTYFIKNPLVIIAGVGDYDSDVMPPLLGVSQDYINCIKTFLSLRYCILYQTSDNKIEYIDRNDKKGKDGKKLDLREVKKNVKLRWSEDELESFFQTARDYVLKQNPKHDSCIFLISGHGESGDGESEDRESQILLSSTGEPVSLPYLLSFFDGISCRYLVNKPKIVFVDACRGPMTAKPIETLEKDIDKHNNNINGNNSNNSNNTANKSNNNSKESETKMGESDNKQQTNDIHINMTNEDSTVGNSEGKQETKDASDNNDNMDQINSTFYHQQANFQYIYSTPSGYATGDGGYKGGYLMRSVKQVFLNQEIVLDQSLDELIVQIRNLAKSNAGKGAVECVEDVSTMTYKVVFRKRDKN